MHDLHIQVLIYLLWDSMKMNWCLEELQNKLFEENQNVCKSKLLGFWNKHHVFQHLKPNYDSYSEIYDVLISLSKQFDIINRWICSP